MYYDRREHATQNEWMRGVNQSLRYLTPLSDCRRMVNEYMTQLYEPAHAAFSVLLKGNFEPAREKAVWNARVAEVWDRVRIVETSPAPLGAVTSGKEIQVRAAVDLAGLRPKDVRVEAVLGRVGPNGNLEDTEVIVLPATEEFETVTGFSTEIEPRHTGRRGYRVRVSPNHYEDPLTRPCPDLLRWS